MAAEQTPKETAKAPAASAPAPQESPRELHRDASSPRLLTVGDLAQRAGLPRCTSSFSLADVAQLMLSSGQGAVLVTDDSGPLGIVTERDLLQSFLKGAPKACSVDSLLRGRRRGVGPRVAAPAPPRGDQAPVPPAPARRPWGAPATSVAPAPGQWPFSATPEEPLRDALPRLLQPPSGGYLLVPGTDMPQGAERVLSPWDLTRAVASHGWESLMELMQEAEVKPLSSLQAVRRQQEEQIAEHIQRAATAASIGATAGTMAGGAGPEVAATAAATAAAATVAEFMEPVGQVPSWAPGSTLQQLLQALLSSEAHAALVADQHGVHDLATAADALWAFQQELCPTTSGDTWQRLASRPGRVGLHRHKITADTPLQQAAAAMLGEGAFSAGSQVLPHLLAVQPGSEQVVGILSPPTLARAAHAEAFIQPSGPVADNEGRRIASSEAKTPPQPAPPAPVFGEPYTGRDEAPLPATPPPSPTNASTVPPSSRRTIQVKQQPEPMTVATLAVQRDTPMCSPADSLADAFSKMVASGRTAAVVMDSNTGVVCGVLTENDAMRAMMEEVPWQTEISQWLHGSAARLPGFMVPALTLPGEATVAEAAACMSYMASDGNFACHHLLVPGQKEDAAHEQAGPSACPGAQQLRLLSALDLATGMIDAAAQAAVYGHGDVDAAAAGLCIDQVMKPCNALPVCTPNLQLRDAFELLTDTKQNCACVVSEDKPEGGSWLQTTEADESTETSASRARGTVHGVVTAADALRAFHDRLPGNTTVADVLKRRGDRPSNRVVSVESSLKVAATAMTESGLHHLLVLDPQSLDIMGVVSALDIVRAVGGLYTAQAEVPEMPQVAEAPATEELSPTEELPTPKVSLEPSAGQGSEARQGGA